MSANPKLQGATRFDVQLTTVDREFFQDVFRKHNVALYRFVCRMGISSDLAQDIVQDTYLRVVRQNEPHKLATAPRGYLFRVAINLLRDRLRRERLHTQMVSQTLAETEPALLVLTPEHALQQAERVAALRAAIRELTNDERRILLLHRFSHLTCREIAKELGLPLRTVERRLGDALGFCLDRVGGRDHE